MNQKRRNTMRILSAALIFISIATMAVAKDAFTDKDLKDLWVIEIREGKVVIEDSDGKKAEVEVGDRIGKDHKTVAGFEKGAIVVEHGTTRARVPLGQGVVREEKVSR
jgi:hypothetical protein